MKSRIFLVFMSVVACLCIFTKGLNEGLHKNFWLDERNEIDDIISAPFKTLLATGTTIQFSSTPLHFIFQKIVVGHVLREEEKNLRGFDWRVSFRFFSAGILALGCFLGFLLLFRNDPHIAILIPFIMGTYHFAVYYAGESRPYSLWVALSIVFLSLSYRILNNPTSRWEPPLWFIIAVLLPYNVVTAGFQAVCTGGMVALLLYYQNLSKYKVAGSHSWTKLRFAFSWIFMGCLGSFIIVKTYNIVNPNLSSIWGNLIRQNTTFTEFERSTIGLFDSRSRGMIIIGGDLLLITAGLLPSYFKNAKKYLFIGALAFSQMVTIVINFLAQHMANSYFTERHGIFFFAGRAFIAGGCFLLLIELFQRALDFIQVKWGIKASRFLGLGYLVIFAVFNPFWIQRVLAPQAKIITDIASSYSSYCMGTVKMRRPPSNLSEVIADDYYFNNLNRLRHSKGCVSEDMAPTEHFIPIDYKLFNWIYK